MKDLLWLIVALPFAGALILAFAGVKLSRTVSAIVGVGSVSLSAILTLIVGFEFLGDTSFIGEIIEVVSFSLCFFS